MIIFATMFNRPTPECSMFIDRFHRFRLFEYTLYALIFITALIVPFFLGNFFSSFGWKWIINHWVRLLPYVLIFIVNNYILIPKLLFKDKCTFYIVVCIFSCLVALLLSSYLFSFTMQRVPPFSTLVQQPLKPSPLLFNFTLVIISILLIGFNTGIKSFMRWNEEKIRQAEKDRQHYYTELAFLKHQVSPHFFMNTLNNIHALVDINTKEAKNAIIKLSNLMRYLLYESDVQKVLLKKEIEFIESYIELMRLRYDEENLTVETDFPNNIENVWVPSSLFLSFIENAFKHGVHPVLHSTISIRFIIEDDRLTFRITNKLRNSMTPSIETAGIGLDNVRKRLDLIYRDNYTLDIDTLDNIYKVTLKIPLS